MKYLKGIEEIVEIIAKKSPVKDKIMEITKIYLDAYKSEDFVEDIEELWDFIVAVPLGGYNHSEINEDEFDIEIDDFDEDYIWKCPVISADWKDTETYIGGIETLLEVNKIELDLEDLEYEKGLAQINEVSIQINEKLRKKEYVLLELGLDSDSYEVCIVEEKDFERIKEILENDEELSENVCIKEFNQEI